MLSKGYGSAPAFTGDKEKPKFLREMLQFLWLGVQSRHLNWVEENDTSGRVEMRFAIEEGGIEAETG